ncbi:DUF2891 domain-containing protein [Neisseriaceae bacterium TC5R-5]|nr:DUF2891 domain-containing protein [Neisseriaceae bacterium TC5R-5]
MVLTLQQAAALTALPLTGLTREYPNHIMHVLNGPADIASPRCLHPVFYGCYDWHSAVHGFWLLARCARLYPDLATRPQIEALFASHFQTEAFEQEAAYFAVAGRNSFERPYGWAWLLALAYELELSPLAQARQWRAAMQPLVSAIRERWLAFLPLQTYPIRVGTHFNTAFALTLSLDYARHAQDEELLTSIVQAAERYYLSDANYPAQIEPNGDDFLSGALCEALLMSKVLAAPVFAKWFAAFLPQLANLTNLLQAAQVSDRGDPKICHLDGLNLSRAWCYRQLAVRLDSDVELQRLLSIAADTHLAASLPHVASGHYSGEHWLATFAILALSAVTP